METKTNSEKTDRYTDRLSSLSSSPAMCYLWPVARQRCAWQQPRMSFVALLSQRGIVGSQCQTTFPPTHTHTRSITGHSSFTKRTGKTAKSCVKSYIRLAGATRVVQTRWPIGILQHSYRHKKKIMNAHTLHVAKPKNVGVHVSKAVFCSYVCVCLWVWMCVCTPSRLCLMLCPWISECLCIPPRVSPPARVLLPLSPQANTLIETHHCLHL